MGELTPCIEWPGGKNRDGYGRQMRNGVRKGAHVWAYEDAYGAVHPGLVVRHKCDNPPCVNPEHLELGTQRDNMHDMFARNRRKNGVKGERVNTAKLTTDDVRAIRASNESPTELAQRYGVKPLNIWRIRARETWKHI